MTDMLRELAEVVRFAERYGVYCGSDSAEIIKNHHAEIAQNAEAAKRLRALELAIGWHCHSALRMDIEKRYDEIMRGDGAQEQPE